MPIRAALLSHDFYPIKGGQGRNFFELYTRLQALRPAIETFALSPCANRLPRHRRLLSAADRLPLGQLFFSAGLNLSLSRAVRDLQLDLLIANGPLGGVLLLKKPPCRLVYCVNHTYSQQARYVETQRWKKLLVPAERRAISRADALVAISSTTRDELQAHYGIAESMITLIPVGIDAEHFSPGARREPDSLLYVGRLAARKGLEFLLRAMPLIAAERPQTLLSIVGDGPLRPRLEALAVKLGIESHVTFLGRLDDQELLRTYQGTQLQVVPSLFEGLGVTALEGMACGAAIVASDVPGLRDVVQDGENGLLVPYGDCAALAHAVLRLLQDADLRERLRLAGEEQIRTRFAWPCIVERYREVIQRVMEARAN